MMSGLRRVTVTPIMSRGREDLVLASRNIYLRLSWLRRLAGKRVSSMLIYIFVLGCRLFSLLVSRNLLSFTYRVCVVDLSRPSPTCFPTWNRLWCVLPPLSSSLQLLPSYNRCLLRAYLVLRSPFPPLPLQLSLSYHYYHRHSATSVTIANPPTH